MLQERRAAMGWVSGRFILNTYQLFFVWSVAILVIYASAANAEVYFSDASMEISGSGERAVRACTVILKPSLTLGDAPPRLTLKNSSATTISASLDKPSQYSNITIVQHNIRRPFLGAINVTISDFLTSDFGEMLEEGHLFYVTAQLSDSGKYVSSRYEGIIFDKVLATFEETCPITLPDWGIRGKCEKALEKWMSKSGPGAFAVSKDGKRCASVAGSINAETAITKAMDECAKAHGVSCKIVHTK
jgi:hypothetical protein